jgi:hypothetical protein
VGSIKPVSLASSRLEAAEDLMLLAEVLDDLSHRCFGWRRSQSIDTPFLCRPSRWRWTYVGRSQTDSPLREGHAVRLRRARTPARRNRNADQPSCSEKSLQERQSNDRPAPPFPRAAVLSSLPLWRHTTFSKWFSSRHRRGRSRRCWPQVSSLLRAPQQPFVAHRGVGFPSRATPGRRSTTLLRRPMNARKNSVKR